METSLELHHGDCLEVMKTIPDKSVDLILCDLPYGCLSGGYRASGIHPQSTNPNQNPNKTEFKTEACAWDVKIDLEPFWKEVRRIRRNDHSPCIHFCTTRFGFDLYASNPKEFRYDLVWDKQMGVSFLSANKMPMRSHEMIYVFAKSGAYYERIDITGEFKTWIRTRTPKSKISTQYGGAGRNDTERGGTGKRCALSVIKNNVSSTKGGHPTEKPSELYRFLIERYCPVGGMVLDPTMGSANSVFTAYDMNRSAIGIEKDKTFYDKAVARL
jgi:site-specific DNA-methyltransferase (adenine-specific)